MFVRLIPAIPCGQALIVTAANGKSPVQSLQLIPQSPTVPRENQEVSSTALMLFM